MDLNQVPIHQRLDALLARLDNDDGEEGSDLDYQQFVERRALGTAATPAAVTEIAQDESVEDRPGSDYDLFDDPLPFHSRNQSSLFVDDVDQQSQHDAHSELQSPHSSPPSSPSTPAKSVVANIYKSAGLSPRQQVSEKQRRQSAKQVQIRMEQAARENQELERSIGTEIGIHTVKKCSVNSFLANLSDEEDDTCTFSAGAKPLPGETQKYQENLEKQRFRELVSSPPRMQGLMSFVSTPAPPLHDLRSCHDGENSSPREVHKQQQGKEEDSDSDLEVIPETKTTRMSLPVKNLLKFTGGGHSTSDRKLALEKAKLQNLQRQQIADRRRARLKHLEQHGIDVEEVAKEISEKRKQNAMSAEALLNLERERADALRAAERSDHDSDSESELEIEGMDATTRRSRKKVLSDSEEDSDGEHAENTNTHHTLFEPTEKDPVYGSGNNNNNNNNINSAATRRDTHEDQADGAHIYQMVGRTGTQYVPPLPEEALVAALADSDENENDEEDVIESTLEEDDPASHSLDVVGSENELALPIQPDLSDLRSKDLTLSQHLAEVRQRYLRAQAEQRRKEARERRESKEQKLRKMFIEDQAEESEDEENLGLVRDRRHDNDDDDEDQDEDDDADANAELHDLVDHSNVKVKESELQKRFLEEERLRDQKMLNKLVDGVRGGFRRKNRGGDDNLFLSDDDDAAYEDEADEEIRKRLQSVEAKRKATLMSHNTGIGKLASNARAAAFFTSISEDLVSRPVSNRKTSVQESLEFLRSVAEKDGESLPEPQPLNLRTPTEPPGDADEQDTKLPALNLALRRASSVRVATRVSSRGAYVSRISAADLGNTKTVEILQSLHRPDNSSKKPRKRFVAANRSEGRESKKFRPSVVHNSTRSGEALFKRHWS